MEVLPVAMDRCGSHVLNPEPPAAVAAVRRNRLECLKAKPGTRKFVLKNHFIAMVGEFVGTTLFLIFALGGANVASRASTNVQGGSTRTDGDVASVAAQVNTSNLLYIAFSFGVSLSANVWVFFRISGGLFNPAVSFGMMLVGAIKPLRAALLVISQILGGIAASAIVYGLLPGTLNVQTALSTDTSITRGLFIEMFLTAMLMLTILLLAAEKSRSTFIAPIGIGMALFIAELLGVYFTGGSLNPARSFGPAVVLGSFVGYHWIYWVGPGLGAMLAAGFYLFIKFLEYETCLGPDCDGDGRDCPIQPDMQAPSSALLGAPHRPSVAAGMGGMGSHLSVHHTHTRDGAESSNHTLSGPVSPEQLDRIEALLGQLVAGGKAM
ncbi:hypothetical protein JCM1841_003275 [Sporobolomyces salmonicolor]